MADWLVRWLTGRVVGASMDRGLLAGGWREDCDADWLIRWVVGWRAADVVVGGMEVRWVVSWCGG